MSLFWKKTPHYSNFVIQGEQHSNESESQNWVSTFAVDPEQSIPHTQLINCLQNSATTTPVSLEQQKLATLREAQQDITQARVPSISSRPDSNTHEQGNSTTHLSIPVTEQSDLNIPIAPRKPTRTCGPYQIQDFVYYGNLSTRYQAFVSKVDQIHIPNTLHEALKMPEWKAATYDEIRALEKNYTWEITKLP